MSGYEDFLAAPSESLLVALTKEQLFCIADYYLIEVTLPKRSNKDQLVDFIRERLKEKLSGGTPVEPTPLTVPDQPLSNMSQLTFDEQKELLQMQLEEKRLDIEQEREHKKWVVVQELEQRRIEAFDREKDRLLEMERLKHTEHEPEQARELERTRLKLEAEGRGSAGQHSGLGSMI